MVWSFAREVDDAAHGTQHEPCGVRGIAWDQPPVE
jgi:hypothetical protein